MPLPFSTWTSTRDLFASPDGAFLAILRGTRLTIFDTATNGVTDITLPTAGHDVLYFDDSTNDTLFLKSFPEDTGELWSVDFRSMETKVDDYRKILQMQLGDSWQDFACTLSSIGGHIILIKAKDICSITPQGGEMIAVPPAKILEFYRGTGKFEVVADNLTVVPTVAEFQPVSGSKPMIFLSSPREGHDSAYVLDLETKQLSGLRVSDEQTLIGSSPDARYVVYLDWDPNQGNVSTRPGAVYVRSLQTDEPIVIATDTARFIGFWEASFP